MGAVKPYPPLSATVVGVVTGIVTAFVADTAIGSDLVVLGAAFLVAFLTMLVWWAVVDRHPDKPDEGPSERRP